MPWLIGNTIWNSPAEAKEDDLFTTAGIAHLLVSGWLNYQAEGQMRVTCTTIAVSNHIKSGVFKSLGHISFYATGDSSSEHLLLILRNFTFS